jgi:hypothetical protein
VKIDETVVEEIVPEPEKKKTTREKSSESKTEAKSEEASADTDNEASDADAADAKPSDQKLETAETDAPVDAPVEKQYKTYIKPHALEVRVEEKVHGCRLLDPEQVKSSKKRIKSLEKRDENLKLKHEAKNFLETQIYEFRAWLQEEENQEYVSEKEREKWIEKCNEELTWFDDEGYAAKSQEFTRRGKVLEKQWQSFKERKFEHNARNDLMPGVFAALKKLKDELPSILESKPWISEDEGKDAFDRIDDMQKWLEERTTAQMTRKLSEEPAYKVDEIEKRLKKVNDTVKKVIGKAKPKEKKPKEDPKDEKKEEDIQ